MNLPTQMAAGACADTMGGTLDARRIARIVRRELRSAARPTALRLWLHEVQHALAPSAPAPDSVTGGLAAVVAFVSDRLRHARRPGD